MHLAVGPAAQRLVRDRLDRGPERVGVPHHPAERGSSEELEGDHRRHRVAGQAEHRLARDDPEGQGLGRLDRHLPPLHGAQPVEHHLDVVEVAHAHAAARDQRVALGQALLERRGDGGFIVGDDAEVDGVAARLVHHRDKRRPVGVADLTRPQGTAVVDQLVAGRQHTDTGPAEHRNAPVAQAGQHAEVAGPEHGEGLERDLARGEVLARRTNVVTGARGACDRDEPVVVDPGVLHHHDGVGPLGDRCARHDAHRLAHADRAIRRPPGGQRGDDLQARSCLRVGSPHREAVHRGVGERRDVLIGAQLDGRDATERVCQRDRGGMERSALGEDASLRVVERDH